MHSAKKVSFNWMSDFFARNEISDRKTHQTSKCIEHKKTEINIAMRRYVLHDFLLLAAIAHFAQHTKDIINLFEVT